MNTNLIDTKIHECVLVRDAQANSTGPRFPPPPPLTLRNGVLCENSRAGRDPYVVCHARVECPLRISDRSGAPS